MTLVDLRQPIGDGVSLHVYRDDGDFYAIVGGWTVTTQDGYLLVYQPGTVHDQAPLLKVPLKEPVRA